MANIRKSFNFRSGLQVDNDNFVINSNGLVGIGTSVPSVYLLNVYGDARITGLTTAKTISLSENLDVSGIATVGVLTATTANIGVATFTQIRVGNSDLVSNLIGYARTTFITNNGGIGLHTTSKIGINTTTSPGASDPELSVYGDVNVTGVITASSFSGSLSATDLTGTIDNARLPATISVTNVNAAFTGNLSGDATGLSGTPDITVNDVISASISNSGSITGASIDVGSGIATAGTVDSTNISNSATVSSLDITASNSVGIGTDDTTYEAHIRRTGASDQSILKVTSDQKESIVAIGRSTSITDSNNENALLRFGNTSGAYQYSSYDTLDIINQGNGNINSYIDNAGSGNAFMWLRGTINPLMTLTRDGNLGIGITNPTHKLNVQGISTFTGNAYFNSNVTLDGNLILTSGSFTGDVTGDLTGNVTATSGRSIFDSIDVGQSGGGSAVDLSSAGAATERFMIPPTVSNTERNAFTSPIDGSVIYNIENGVLETYDGTNWVELSKSVSSTPVSTNAGTAVTFTDVPSWAKKITVMFDQISVTTANQEVYVRLGTSGGIISTGYSQGSNNQDGGGRDTVTTAFSLFNVLAGDTTSGNMYITKFSSSVYTSTHNLHRGGNSFSSGGGSLSGITGTIDRIEISVETNNFDAGQINVLYE